MRTSARGWAGIATTLLAMLMVGLTSETARARGQRAVLVIYDEASSAGRPLFTPDGWMPDGNGIAFDDKCGDRPHSGESCIKFGYDASGGNDWVGIYFLAGGWGERPGVDVYAKLGIQQGAPVVLSFWARSDEGARIECKVGGVNRGDHPDSVPFAKSTRYFTTTKDWKRYSIDLTRADLSNLQGGFCVVTSRAENRSTDQVWFYLDDIKIEGPRVSAPPRQDTISKLKGLKWIAYTPSEFDPTTKPLTRPSEAGIIRDLKPLVGVFDGIVTYGCSDGQEQVARIAAKLGFKGFIQGIWDPRSEVERANLRLLADDGLVDAVCCGNEGLGSRYDWDVLGAAMNEIRERTGLLVTTTEQIEDYGDERLVTEPDFLFPNVHPVWAGLRDPEKAAEWLGQQLKSLQAVAEDRLIVVKETGWPSSGGEAFTPENQLAFWRGARGIATKIGVPLVVFEAYDMKWKKEPLPGGGDVGGSWGILDADHVPKPVAEYLGVRAK